MFFDPVDRRTDAERQRDLAQWEKRQGENLLAIGFLKNNVRPLLKNAGAEVGLAGTGLFGIPELLVEVDGVTYRLNATVSHEN